MPDIKPSSFTDAELRSLAEKHPSYREAVREAGGHWSGAWGRAFKQACGPVTSFGNTGSEYTRFDNSPSVEQIHEDYLALTDRKEYALDIDIHLTDSDFYNCVCAGDTHIGPPECAYEEWHNLCQWTAQQPNTGMIFHGDGANVNTTGGPASPAVDKLPYDEQIDLLIYTLGPIADADSLHLLLAGNHEKRIRRSSGVDECPIRRVAKELDVPYGNYEQFVRWRINSGSATEIYTGYHHHGRGSARTEGGVLNNLIKMAKINRADYLAAGHSHRLFAHMLTWREVARDGEVIARKAPVLNTGSYQRTQGETYSTEKAYAPALIGAASIHLYGSKHSVHART